jgi:hypothetical protein
MTHIKTEDAKHTPGPWKSTDYTLVETVGKSTDYTLVEADGDGINEPRLTLAIVFTPSEGSGSYKEREANALLIAAAPELISALERGLAVIKAARRIACNRPIAENPLVAEMQTAGGAVLAMEDAIAKAKGGLTRR